jgi:hypothetical protein
MKIIQQDVPLSDVNSVGQTFTFNTLYKISVAAANRFFSTDVFFISLREIYVSSTILTNCSSSIRTTKDSNGSSAYLSLCLFPIT